MSLLAQTSTQQLVTSSITATTAQFQTLSTQTFNVSSINGIVPGAAFNGSTLGLSSATVNTSSLQASNIKSVQGYISSLVVDSLAIGSNSGYINMGDIITTSISSLQINTGLFTASGLLTASGTVCTSQLIVSTINGSTLTQLVGPPIQSTVVGLTQSLGSAGYISTSQLYSTVTGIGSGFTGSTVGLSAGTINTSTINSVYLSSVQGYVSSFRTDSLTVGGPTGYVSIKDLTAATVSTGQLVAGAGFISSLQINSLSFGPSGYVIVGDVIANSLSTKKLNTQALYANNAYIGNVSTQSAILFPGIDGAFKGTAVAEQTTGIGTQELLLYKVSSTTDQIRLQTTGNIVFEAGVASRSWPSTSVAATPTLYIQGSTSNVGVGTAAPATTLDVFGTGRFQIVSTYALNVSSINGAAPFNGSTLILSTGSITTNSLQAYSYLNMTGGVFSNVATEYFTTPKFTTTFTPTSIAGLKAWFDASQTTSITSNGTGQVAVWANLATGYANAAQATTSNQPYTGKYTVNNLNTMQFNNYNGVTFGNISWASQNQCVIAVIYTPVNPYSSGGNNWIFGGGGDRTGTQSFIGYEYGGSGFEFGTSISGAYSLHGYIAGSVLVSQNTFIGNPWIVTVHKGSVTNGAYINGTSNATVGNFGTGSFSDKIGGASDGGGNTFYMCEYIHYDADISLAQKQTIEGYLAWKWGIQGTLNGTHPYYSTPPPPVGTVYLPAGSVGTDATSNIAIQATANTKISLAANTQITGLLTVSTIGLSSITGTYANFSTLQSQSVSTLQTVTSSMGIGIANSAYALDVNGIARIQQVSTLSINVSTINSVYLSSVQGYVSSFRTDSLTVGGPTGYVSIKDLTTATVSTGQIVAGAGFISSLQINTLSFGPTGYVIVGDVIANSLSTKKLNTQALYANNVYIGNASSQSAILFPGIDGTYRGTAVAEQTTGIGTQELLLYKVSSTTDQIRLQTTGNIVFEAGAPSRSWNSTTQLATPTLYIAGSSSNVGVGTAAPATTLDVAGTGRFLTISSLALNVSSINGAAPGGGGGTLASLNIPYSTLTTNTLYLVNTNSTSIGFGTMTSSPSQFYIGDVNTQINLSTNSNPTFLVEQQVPISNVRVSTFTTTGSFVVPSNVNYLTVHLWGSGGGGGGGGGGAYVSGTLPVTPGTTLAISLGAGGGTTNGGGYAGIFINSVALKNILVIAGGGGASGSRADDSGGYGGITQGGSGGYRGVGQGGPVGGSQTINTNFAAWQLQGENAGAGGGGGYWGGQGGNNNSVDVVGGGGGSSYIARLLNFYGENGTSSTTGGVGGGKGTPYNSGTYGDAGVAGAVVLVWSGGIRRANMIEVKDAFQRRLAISESLYMGINIGSTINSNYNFEVRNGTAAISTLFTTSISTTSLTIPYSNYNPASVISTLPIYAMNTMSNGAQIAFGSGGMYGTVGKNAQFYINDVKQLTNQFSATDPLVLIEQDFPTASNANVIVTNFSASGTFTVPANVTAVRAYMWGQGGQNNSGGGGAFVCGTFTVTPGDTIQVAVNYGGGSSAGGGLAGVFRGTISQANAIGIAAGGGAGGSFTLDLGGYGGVVSGGGGSYRYNPNATTGGTQTAAGTGSATGGALAGGNSTAGGGAGYWGGGGGANNSVDVIGGGGGSSYIGGLFNVFAENGQQGTPNGGAAGGGKWAPFNNGTYGDAGSGVTGYVVLVYTRQLRYANLLEIRTSYTSTITAITNTNSMGINVVTVGSTFSLDVGGTGRFQGLSTLNLQVSSINGALPGSGGGTTFTGTLGTVSSLTALRFYGLTGQYTNTAVAEVSTGVGTQELLLYKVSSVIDQIRIQTTGNVIFETGVSARGWPTATRIATPSFYIAGSNSNVGINTSNPLTTLDVAGTGRFQTLSSLNITAGSINYSVAFV